MGLNRGYLLPNTSFFTKGKSSKAGGADTDGHGRTQTDTNGTQSTPKPPTRQKPKRERDATRASPHAQPPSRTTSTRGSPQERSRSTTHHTSRAQVRPQPLAEHPRVDRSAPRRARRTPQALHDSGGHANKGEPGDAEVGSCTHSSDAPRATQPSRQERASLSLSAGTHPPPRLLRASRSSMGAERVDRWRRLTKGTKGEADALGE